MAVRPENLTFELSNSGRSDGSLKAAYVRLRDGKVCRTVEIEPDLLLCDYDRNDNLIGIEILGPVALSQVAQQVSSAIRWPFKRFMSHMAPAELIVA